MRVASFNVENLFRRSSALNRASRKETRRILQDFKTFSDIIGKQVYSAADKAKLTELLVRYQLERRNAAQAQFFQLNEVREKLFRVPRGSDTPEIIVDGRAAWDGWLEMKKDKIDSAPIDNTARVIAEVNADVLAVIEAEDRTALQLFNDQVLKRHGAAYPHNLLVDGNDMRGIDVGIFSREPIISVRSHIDAGLPGPRIFSRDCAEYQIALSGGGSLLVLINHFKSKGFGSASASNARRKAQAKKAAEIYGERVADNENVLIVGDFNDTPASAPLSPLLQQTDLRDVMSHPSYVNGPDRRPGTFKTGTASNKLDYILLSPALWARVENVGVERRGIWAPSTFAHFDTVTGPELIASDHAAVWVDLNL